VARHTLARSLTLLALALALASCGRSRAPESTLLLITVDTLRADHLGAYASKRWLTPHVDALAAQSQVFESAYAPAPFTRPSIAALMTGREPARIGMWSNVSHLSEDVPTLAGSFANAGWATGAVVSNPVLKRGTGLARGFGLYDDNIGETEAVRDLPERTAAATTDAAVAALDRLREESAAGLFLWVHYQDPHGPYTPPPGYREKFLALERQQPDGSRPLPLSSGESGQGGIPRYQVLGDERMPAFYRAGYAGEVLHVDQEIGRLLDALRERGLFDNAVIALTADHGEGLGENDYWFAHGENLSEALLRVPLVIRTPGRQATRRAGVAALVDVAGTLLAEFGLALPGAHDGRGLLALDAPASPADVFLSTLAYIEPPMFGMLNPSFRYVIDKPGGVTRERLFRIGEETEDVAALHPDAFEELRNRTRERVRELKASRQEVRAPPGVDERRQLRALGYVDE
jgi:arylsulfatase